MESRCLFFQGLFLHCIALLKARWGRRRKWEKAPCGLEVARWEWLFIHMLQALGYLQEMKDYDFQPGVPSTSLLKS